MTENPNILSIASIIIAIVGTVLIPILTPITSWGVREVTSWCEFNRFKNMIDKDYAKPIDERINKKNYSDFVELNSDITKRLDYLITSELSYLNLKSNNQFKMIRYVEYLKSYCKITIEIYKLYGNPKTEEEQKKIRTKKIENVKNIYHDTKQDYVDLKRDKLLDDKKKYVKATQSELNKIPIQN